MRVVLVTGIYPPDHGGPARFVPQLALACHQRGWSVEVITLSDQPKTGETHSWSVTRIARNLSKWRRFLLTTWTIFRRLKKADVMFANGLFEEVSLASRIARRPWVGKFVGDPVWESYQNSHSNPVTLEVFQTTAQSPQLRLRRTGLVFALRQAHCVLTPSTQLQSLLETWGVQNIRFVPNGVEIVPLSVTPPSVDVISVARLVPWKHLDTLIVACALEGLSLDVVGEGPEFKRLENLARELSPCPPIKLRGSLPGEEIQEALDSARIFALLSSYEGMSFALLEAMSRCKPVVVGDNPGNRAVIEGGVNGLVVPYDDVEQVRLALRRLTNGPELARKLGLAGRKTVEEKYSLAATIAATLELLDNAIETPK
jgi:glycosyltransferase involved in cell wall biosynthesis